MIGYRTLYEKRTIMNPVAQDILGRKNEIISEINAIFKVNMKITNWDVPEADDVVAGEMILNIMQEALDGLKAKLEEGEFRDY
jgi:hypothetical protein